MEVIDAMRRAFVCVIMPTYNNAGTLAAVLRRIIAITGADVIVVDDGSTDGTQAILASFNDIVVLRNPRNLGKGRSLKRAFREATQRGYRNAITIDSDGQHDPADIPAVLAAIIVDPDAMIMGARNMKGADVPGRSSFGNRFSNFWFLVETGIRLPDTQTGFRAYPLPALSKIRTISPRFGYEVETIVKLAWRGIPFRVVPVKVTYDMPDRVSHFRPFTDFFHISMLNTWLVIRALAWYWPRRVLSPKRLWRVIREEAVKHDESTLRKASSIGFGLFMGIVPIWGFQLLVGIPLAILFRLNKVLFITAAHISIPPMIPIIIYVSYLTGAPFMGSSAKHYALADLSLEAIGWNAAQYICGSVALSIIAGIVGTVIAWFVIRSVRRK